MRWPPSAMRCATWESAATGDPHIAGIDTAAPAGSSGLQHSLKQRHMMMIAFGGVIGAGLFVGSGVVIKSAGPAAVISFAITGLLIVLVMRMLGEMAVSQLAGWSFFLAVSLGKL